MKKVKLTQEQAKAIEYALQGVIKYRVNPDKLLLHASMDNVIFHNVLEPLNTIDVATLAKALYIGYEVEPQFKVGDEIIDKLTADCPVIKIKNINDEGFSGEWLLNGRMIETFVLKERARHATPDEIAKEKRRRWWAKHGREVWELLEGDLITNRLTGKIKEIEFRQNGTDSFGLGSWKVVCFAEDRLDQ